MSAAGIVGISIGNSTTCIGLFNADKLLLSLKIPNQELGDIKSHLPKEKISAVIIASVVPDKNELFSRVVQGFYGIIPKFIDSSLIKGGYPELGADRVANLIGGSELFGTPICVIDFGTATTIDILSSEEEYIGGIILPGVNLGLKLLHQKTSLLPKISLSDIGSVPILGKSTLECMKSGAYWGEIYRIQKLTENAIPAGQAKNIKFVCTGGMGEVFAKPLSWKYEPWLTLWGLYFIGIRPTINGRK